MVVLAHDDVLHHAVLIDATEKTIILAIGIIAVVGMVNALDGMVVTIKRAVKSISNIGNLRI